VVNVTDNCQVRVKFDCDGPEELQVLVVTTLPKIASCYEHERNMTEPEFPLLCISTIECQLNDAGISDIHIIIIMPSSDDEDVSYLPKLQFALPMPLSRFLRLATVTVSGFRVSIVKVC
jgi:hypothetical protein